MADLFGGGNPRKTCIDDLAKRTGKSREDVEDTLDDILDRADFHQEGGMSPAEAYAKARDEKLAQYAEKAARDRTARIMDMRKDIARHRYYASVDDAIKNLPKVLQWAVRGSARLAMEAKLVGINLPIFKGRLSVDAQYIAMRRLLVGGFARDLEESGLIKIFSSRALEDKWTDELAEINKGDAGKPGITKDAQALKIAQAIHKWQVQSVEALNREGAWVRSYWGYVTRSSHDADKIGEAGQVKWIADTLPKLDIGRTFGTRDLQRARDALGQMYGAMSRGDHFDYGRPIDEPLYPSTAKKASASRELHFKSAADWRAYNEQYGVHNATHTVVNAMMVAARRTALMREFGTKPREAYENDKQFLLGKLKGEIESLSSKIGALEKAAASPGADAATKAQITQQIADLSKEAQTADARYKDFEKWQIPLDNRFAQIDGTSQRPVDRTKANVVAGIMSVQRTSKLGNLFMTHLASLPTKMAELSYWGVPFAQRFGSLFRGFTQGAEGTARREAIDTVLVGLENRLGHMMNAYDVADAPAGLLAKWEATFFKLTGVNAVIDNQRGDFEAMAAAHLGAKRDLDWSAIGRKEQRVVQGFGIGEAEWRLLKQVEWSKLDDGRTYLFPSDALKLSDEQISTYLRDTQQTTLGRAEPNAQDIAKARNDLAMTLAATYSDRGGYAIPMPSARIRAMLFGKSFEPGTNWNMAKKLFWQFKIWPADMITRAWERELYGRIGDGRMDRVSGLVEIVVAGAMFGVAAEGLRDLIKGQNPLEKLEKHPLAALLAGFQRSGMGSIVGDFFLHQFDRHGLSAAANLLGPTAGQIDTLADLFHAGGHTKEGMFSASAMRQRGADMLRLLKDNTPFMNLWATQLALDTLIWHRLQEWINPGYLRRREQRMKQMQGTEYWISPAKTDEWLTGRRTATTPQGGWNLAGP